jgi:hypothetical protein
MLEIVQWQGKMKNNIYMDNNNVSSENKSM